MSSATFNDVYNSLRGEVTIIAHHDSGESELLVNDKNLIVSSGRQMIAKSLIMYTPSYVTDVAFGSGGTLAGNSSAIIPVTSGETAPITPILGLISGTDYIFSHTDESVSATTPRISFSIVVPKTGTSLNNRTINELGLMLNTSPSTAFALKRFADIVKSDSISLSINWVIYF